MNKIKKIFSAFVVVSMLASMISAFSVTANAAGVEPTLTYTISAAGKKAGDEVVLNVKYTSASADNKVAMIQDVVSFDTEYLSFKESTKQLVKASQYPATNPTEIRYAFLAMDEDQYLGTASEDVTTVTFTLLKDVDKKIVFTPSSSKVNIGGTDEYTVGGANALTVVNSDFLAPDPTIALSADVTKVKKGETATITATPSNFAEAPTYVWSVSGNTSATTVVDNGALTVGADETSDKVTVTATAGDVTATIDINVILIKLSASAEKVAKGETVTITATPKNFDETPTITWELSGNEKDTTTLTDGVLAVDEDETATKLTVKATAGDVESTIEIPVIEYLFKNWELSTKSITVGSSVTVKAVFENAPSTSYIEYTSDDESVVRISGTTATGLAAGSAYITATLYKSSSKDKVLAESTSSMVITVTKKSTTPQGGGSTSGTGGSGSLAGGNYGSGSAGAMNIASKNDIYNVNFTDMDQAEWARTAVESLAKKGIVAGLDDTTFAPNASVTRAQFVKMISSLYNLVNESSVFATQSFSDVSKADWFFNYVEVCAQLGIVNGDGGKFRPNDIISRQEMAVIIYRTATVMGTNLAAVEAEKTFDDAASISDYAKTAVSTLQKAGVIGGTSDTTFEATASCTRAQAATIIYNMYTKYAK